MIKTADSAKADRLAKEAWGSTKQLEKQLKEGWEYEKTELKNEVTRLTKHLSTSLKGTLFIFWMLFLGIKSI